MKYREETHEEATPIKMSANFSSSPQYGSKQLARVQQPGSPDSSTPSVPLPALSVPAEEWLQVAIHGDTNEVREVLVDAASKLVEEKKRILGIFQQRIDVSWRVGLHSK